MRSSVARITPRRQRGVTLIELIVFILVITVALQGVLLGFSAFFRDGGATGAQLNLATQLAQERLETILADRRLKGFASFGDPCAGATPPGICTPPNSTLYSLPSPTLNGAWSVDPDTSRYRVLTVRVNGPDGQLAELTTLVANY